MSWLPWREEEPASDEGWREPSRKEVSAAKWTSLKGVFWGVQKCEAMTGVDLAVARRELAGVLRESMTTLQDVARGVEPGSRVEQVARQTAEEMVEMARQWLIFDFLLTGRTSSMGETFTSEETSEPRQAMWKRAEEVLADTGEARGDDLVAAEQTLRQLIDEVEMFSSPPVTAPMPARQAQLWRLAAEEIAGRASAALAKPAGSTNRGEQR